MRCTIATFLSDRKDWRQLRALNQLGVTGGTLEMV
jgi:hypothetical protein